MSTKIEALRIKVQMKADAGGSMPVFVATCLSPELLVTGHSLDELRLNLDRAIADTLTEMAGAGDVEPRPLLLEFAA
jgi:hypothetical protein